MFLKKIAFLGLILTLGAALAAPVFAANGIQGGVGGVSASDGTALGQAASRIWSTSFPIINANSSGALPTCVNARCLRNYSTNTLLQPGGYIGQGEGTAAYNNDLDGQTYYQLFDGQVAGNACNHASFYSVQGLIGHNSSGTGDFRTATCPGLSQVNCFERSDTRFSRSLPLANTNTGYGASPHSIPSLGGLSPVPVVRVGFPGSACLPGQARLTWDDPEMYAGAMKEGVLSPVKGVRVYSNNNSCSACPDSSTGWTAGAAFAAGTGATGTCVPITGPTWFALTVRLAGPNSATDSASEVETGRTGATGFVGANSQCVAPTGTVTRIVSVAARYTGRGTVSVNFTTGSEGGVQHYFVSRASTPNGPFTHVSEPIVPLGDGNTYTVTDKARTGLGRMLYYAVEVVAADGTTERSGATAVTLPGAKRKLGSK